MSVNHRDVPILTIAGAEMDIGHLLVKIDKKDKRRQPPIAICGGVEMEPTWSAVGVIGLSTVLDLFRSRKLRTMARRDWEARS
jgi:hypothetical protein